MPLLRLPLRALLAALVLLPLAACDETGGFAEDVNVAVDDAVIARQSGNYAQAVAILRNALERAPESAEVRVELATTILERDGVNLLDIDRISTFLTTGASGGAARPADPNARAACPYASDPTAEAFDPTDLVGFDDLMEQATSITETVDLLAPVMPAALQTFDICTSVVDGELVYDRAAAIADLRSQGLSDAQIGQALAVNALAKFVDAYLFVTTELPQQTTWYRLADGSIAICVDDPEALQAQAEDAVAHIGEAVLSLDARAAHLGASSAATEIVDLALDAYEDVRDALGFYCTPDA